MKRKAFKRNKRHLEIDPVFIFERVSSIANLYRDICICPNCNEAHIPVGVKRKIEEKINLIQKELEEKYINELNLITSQYEEEICDLDSKLFTMEQLFKSIFKDKRLAESILKAEELSSQTRNSWNWEMRIEE